jgi:hypothetical protein
MNLAIKFIYIGIVFIITLGFGLMGIGAYMLLPKSIRRRIENFHDK